MIIFQVHLREFRCQILLFLASKTPGSFVRIAHRIKQPILKPRILNCHEFVNYHQIASDQNPKPNNKVCKTCPKLAQKFVKIRIRYFGVGCWIR